MAKKAKEIAGNQMRTLAVFRARLLSMSGEWTDIDGHLELRLQELSGQVNVLQREMVRKEKQNGNQ